MFVLTVFKLYEINTSDFNWKQDLAKISDTILDKIDVYNQSLFRIRPDPKLLMDMDPDSKWTDKSSQNP